VGRWLAARQGLVADSQDGGGTRCKRPPAATSSAESWAAARCSRVDGEGLGYKGLFCWIGSWLYLLGWFVNFGFRACEY